MVSQRNYPGFHHVVTDGFSISDQVTWLLPTIEGGKRAAQQKVSENGEGSISFIHSLIKSSGIYALSSLAAPFVSLILAPFLTRSLTHEDYGALAILNTVIALVAGLTQLGLSASFFRLYNYDYEVPRDRLDLLSTAMILLVSTSLVTVMVFVGAASWLAPLLLKIPSYINSIRIVGVVVFLQNLAAPGLSWLRAENRVVFFTSLSITNLLINAGATVLLVGMLHMGINGSLIALGCGYASVVIVMLPLMLLRAGLRLRLDIGWELLAFGVPHVANLISGWILQLSDRYLLGLLGSLSQVASYSVAYSLGGILSSLVISPFSLAWFPAMFSIAKKDEAPRIFQLVFRWYALSLLFATLSLSFFGVNVLDLLFPPVYHAAAPVIPIIALSTACSGFSVMLSIGVSIQRKSWLATLFTTISALLNVGLNIVLIPLYGAIGAATATLAAYVVFTFVAHFVSQQFYPVSFEVKLLFSAMLVGIVLYMGGYYLTQTQGVYGVWTVDIATLGLYGGFLILLAKCTPLSESAMLR